MRRFEEEEEEEEEEAAKEEKGGHHPISIQILVDVRPQFLQYGQYL